ncbi:inorganic phosphate transporter [Egibacter rhizosphaerae]|uniref:inorganic phosphate transporter n=1 Tax=Egibacter rhizosphaerae TaxID=1670831 RepID=UPI0013F15EC8|nr:inorganic phosphate transporter [Egibacter rhizosphaerae]
MLTLAVTDPNVWFLLVAAVFAVLNGVNDGGTLLTLGLKVVGLRLVIALVLLAIMVGLVPALLGTQVASTLAGRLVAFEGPLGQQGLLIGVAGAVIVTMGLARSGLPTSLTLALIGGIAGVGLGAGLPVDYGVVGAVLLAAAAAPLVGALLAYVLSQGALHVRLNGDTTRFVARAHRVAFGLQAVAYGANDGQKMLAVAAVAAGFAVDPVPRNPWMLIGAALAFGLGTLLGLRRFSRIVGGVIPIRPPNAVIGELSAAAAVLGSAALGAPVSMTQAISGGLVGTGVSEGYRRVRWNVAGQILVAWVVTFPLAFALAAAGGLVLR